MIIYRTNRLTLAKTMGKLLLLLRIAHLQFSKVPSTREFEAILNVAILCGKYNCVGLVRPWLPFWLVYEETQYNKPGYEE